MADTRGTFRLKNVRQNILNNEYVPVPNVWLLQDDIAHSRPYPVSNLQRWNLGTSTMSDSGLACSRYWGQASGNTTFSYFAGGGVSPGITGKTSTDKLSYSPYTFAATPTANTSFPIRSGGALSSNLAAYITAGYNSTGSPSYNGSYVDKILFATDTKSTLSDKFGETGNSWASLSDGKGGGYNFNGDTPTATRAKLYKITYSTDGMAYVPASNTLIARRESSAEMMNPSAGYNTGGDLSGTISSTEKLSWSSGTWTAVPGGKLVRNTKRMASGSGRSHGFAGGGDGNVSPVYTDFYKLDFSTETFGRDPALNFSVSNYGYYPQKSTTTPLDGLYGADKAGDRNSFWSGDNAKRWFDSSSVTPNTGYFGNGARGPGGSGNDTIFKTDFDAETISQIPATLSSSKYYRGNWQSGTAAYWTGGYPWQPGKCDKFTFATATNAHTPGAACGSMYKQIGNSGSPTAGYVMGGSTGVGAPERAAYANDVMNKITFATDTRSALPGVIDHGTGHNPQKNMQEGGSGTSGTVGYWFWGEDGGFYRSFVEKSVWSTDTFSVLPETIPNSPIISFSTASTSTFSMLMGGHDSPSSRTTCMKFTYSTETMSTPTGQLTTGTTNAGSQSNGAAGWVSGGGTPGFGITNMQKYTFSTDTVEDISSMRYPNPGVWQNNGGGDRNVHYDANITLAPTATPTPSTFPSVNPALNVFCIFKCGYGQPGAAPVSFNAKMTYSNETIAYTPNMHYTIGEMNTMAGGSSTTKGYTAGGWSSGTMGGSRDYRTSHVYATDVTAKVPGNALSGGNGGGGMFGMNSETEFWTGGGGWTNNQYSNVDKMVFATETGTANPARLSTPTKLCGGTGNKTLGFVCGGNQGPHGNNGNRTNIDKLVYSTGTMSRSPGDLTVVGAGTYKSIMCVGTKDIGYVGGGAPLYANKFVFATETISTPPAGVGGGQGNGVSSVEAGYTSTGSPTEYLKKYTFATETDTLLPGKFPSPSNRKRCRMAAVSTSMFGGAYSSTPNVI